jgi:hypothetical protein
MTFTATLEESVSTGCLAVQVAGLTLLAESRSPGLRLEVGTASKAFLTLEGDPDLSLAVSWRQPGSAGEGRLVFESGGPWKLFDVDGRRAYRFYDSRLGSRPYKEALLAPDGIEGEIFLDPSCFERDQPVDALEFPLDELLFLNMLSAHGGVEMHACGVAAPSGEGYLFTGHSGDGKTTTARLWEEVPGATILSDDRIVLRRGSGGEWRMHGTPWHGEAALAANVDAPVTAIFVLGRGDRNAFEEMPRPEAITGLLARCFPPFHDERGISSVLAVLDNLTREVPCQRFAFVPGPEAVKFVIDEVRNGYSREGMAARSGDRGR